MRRKLITVSTKVTSGGALATKLFPEDVGFSNYRVKRNFRRSDAYDIRREGALNFRPNTLLPEGSQPFPTGGEDGNAIRMVSEVTRPNGQRCILASTDGTLYRYMAMDDGAYALDYFGEDYNAESGETWGVIGSGYNGPGRQWRSEVVNGTAFINNGVDLPITYRVEWTEARPVYELRDAGVASVDVIKEYNGTLFCGNIRQLTEEAMDLVMGAIQSGTVTAGQSGSTYSGINNCTTNGTTFVVMDSPFFAPGMEGKTLRWMNGERRTITAVVSPVTAAVDSPVDTLEAMPVFVLNGYSDLVVSASGDIFTSDMVGETITWESGDSRTITEFLDARTVIVDADYHVDSGVFEITNPAAYRAVTDSALLDGIQYRLVWSQADEPSRFAATVPGSITKGTFLLKLKRPTRFLSGGNEIIVVGAGINGGNLTAKILNIAADKRTIILDATAFETVTDTEVSRSDTVGSTSGYADIQDDGSAIQGIETLDRYLVILKEDSIFIGSSTGNASAPYAFERRYTGPNGLYHKTTLQKLSYSGREFLVYAGRDDFFSYSLANGAPDIIQPLSMCRNLFFDRIDSENTMDAVVATNKVTHEVVFSWPDDGVSEDRSLCFDYRYGTASTWTLSITCGNTVRRPMVGSGSGPYEEWFIFGTSTGKVARYGNSMCKNEEKLWAKVTISHNDVVCNVSMFDPRHVGRSLVFESTNGIKQTRVITGYSSPARITIGGDDISVSQREFEIIPQNYTMFGGDYVSVLESGLDAFGDLENEKRMVSGAIRARVGGHSTAVKLSAFSYYDPESDGQKVFSRLFTGDAIEAKSHALGMFFSWKLEIDGQNNPYMHSFNIFGMYGVNSSGFSKANADKGSEAV